VINATFSLKVLVVRETDSDKVQLIAELSHFGVHAGLDQDGKSVGIWGRSSNFVSYDINDLISQVTEALSHMDISNAGVCVELESVSRQKAPARRGYDYV